MLNDVGTKIYLGKLEQRKTQIKENIIINDYILTYIFVFEDINDIFYFKYQYYCLSFYKISNSRNG